MFNNKNAKDAFQNTYNFDNKGLKLDFIKNYQPIKPFNLEQYTLDLMRKWYTRDVTRILFKKKQYVYNTNKNFFYSDKLLIRNNPISEINNLLSNKLYNLCARLLELKNKRFKMTIEDFYSNLKKRKLLGDHLPILKKPRSIDAKTLAEEIRRFDYKARWPYNDGKYTVFHFLRDFLGIEFSLYTVIIVNFILIIVCLLTVLFLLNDFFFSIYLLIKRIRNKITDDDRNSIGLKDKILSCSAFFWNFVLILIYVENLCPLDLSFILFWCHNLILLITYSFLHKTNMFLFIHNLLLVIDIPYSELKDHQILSWYIARIILFIIIAIIVFWLYD